MSLNPYALYLADDDPFTVLEATPRTLRSLVGPLTVQQAEKATAPGKWSIREITAHLADCEIAFAFRLRQTLSQEHAALQPFDQNAWAQRYGAYDVESALTLFAGLRLWNLKLLQSVSDADCDRPATHPERGTMTFRTIVETMAGHDLNHLRQIRLLSAEVGSQTNEYPPIDNV
jgi:uncharacterized damage-inducible protein DinB